jgi:hypothetical protein
MEKEYIGREHPSRKYVGKSKVRSVTLLWILPPGAYLSSW